MGLVAEQFGGRLRTLRTGAFLTQEELAKKAGISSGQIVRYEAGKNIPREAIQTALAEALEVSPLDFYTSEDIPVFIGDDQDSAAVAKRIGERIRKLCEDQKTEPAFLYRKASDYVGYWSRILQGEALPSAIEAARVAKALGVKTIDLFEAEEAEEKKEFNKGDYVLLPFYDFQASTGHGQAKGKPSTPKKRQLFDLSWINNENEVNKKDLMLVAVVGDSMIPTLNQSDLVLVDGAKAHVPDDGLYVLRMDSALLVKRLRKRPGRKVQVMSDNEIYGSFDLNLAAPPEEMAVVGRVIWVGYKV